MKRGGGGGVVIGFGGPFCGIVWFGSVAGNLEFVKYHTRGMR
jgi:hypothetical protein